jgi:hypothetical protein
MNSVRCLLWSALITTARLCFETNAQFLDFVSKRINSPLPKQAKVQQAMETAQPSTVKKIDVASRHRTRARGPMNSAAKPHQLS